MQTNRRRQQLRELRATARLATRLGRAVALEVGRQGVERVDIKRRIRQGRRLRLVAGVVGLTAAGIAAARIHRRVPDPPVDASDDAWGATS
jgi:hypothetical protein